MSTPEEGTRLYRQPGGTRRPARKPKPSAPEVYLVVMDRGGIFGAYFDAGLAMSAAQAIEGVVCTLPVGADFRKH